MRRMWVVMGVEINWCFNDDVEIEIRVEWVGNG